MMLPKKNFAQSSIQGATKAGTTVVSGYTPYSSSIHAAGKTTSATIRRFVATDISSDWRQCIDYTCSIWQQIISSPVDITIYFSKYNAADGLLAQGSPGGWYENFGSVDPRYFGNIGYPSALANKLNGSAVSGATYDINVAINDNYLYCTNLYGGDASNQYDLVTALLHEIGHGLGFVSGTAIDPSSGHITYSLPVSILPSGDPAVYDNFVRLSSGDLLSFPDESTFLDGAYTLGDAYWTGVSGYGMHLYNPPAFENGSSLSHTDGAYYFFKDLMCESQPLQLAIHNLSSGDMGMMDDIGWNCTGPVATQDYITIIDHPSGAPTTTFNVGYTPVWEIQFVDNYPYGDSYSYFGTNWTLTACSTTGDVVVQTLTGFWGTTAIAALPTGYTWIRDINGRIKGYLSASGTEYPTGSTLATKIDIGINEAPDQPLITVENIQTESCCDIKKVSFYSPGADYFEIYSRDHVGGTWSSWTGTTLASGITSYTFTGLDETISHEYYAVAYNAGGSSTSNTTYNGPCKVIVTAAPNPVNITTVIHLATSYWGYTISNVTITNASTGATVANIPFDGVAPYVDIDLSPYSLASGVYAFNVTCATRFDPASCNSSVFTALVGTSY